MFLFQLVYILFLNDIQVRRLSFMDGFASSAVEAGQHEKLPSRRLGRPQKEERRWNVLSRSKMTP